MTEKIQKEAIEIITKHLGKENILTMLLFEIQKLEGYLSNEALKLLSDKSPYSLSEIYELATFYDAFYLTKPAENIIILYFSPTCQAKDYKFIKVYLHEWIKTNNDFMLIENQDNGYCIESLAVRINKTLYPNITIKKLIKILKDFK